MSILKKMIVLGGLTFIVTQSLASDRTTTALEEHKQLMDLCKDLHGIVDAKTAENDPLKELIGAIERFNPIEDEGPRKLTPEQKSEFDRQVQNLFVKSGAPQQEEEQPTRERTSSLKPSAADVLTFRRNAQAARQDRARGAITPQLDEVAAAAHVASCNPTPATAIESDNVTIFTAVPKEDDEEEWELMC